MANPPPHLPIPQVFKKDIGIEHFFKRMLFNTAQIDTKTIESAEEIKTLDEQISIINDEIDIIDEQIDVLETRTTTVVIHTGGGDLIALRQNEIHDGGAYNIPLASSVESGQRIRIELPDAYAAFNPVCTVSGGDLIIYRDGTDTSITFAGSTVIWLTSNGSDRWIL